MTIRRPSLTEMERMAQDAGETADEILLEFVRILARQQARADHEEAVRNEARRDLR
jgi:hypothetical protein